MSIFKGIRFKKQLLLLVFLKMPPRTGTSTQSYIQVIDFTKDTVVASENVTNNCTKMFLTHVNNISNLIARKIQKKKKQYFRWINLPLFSYCVYDTGRQAFMTSKQLFPFSSESDSSKTGNWMSMYFWLKQFSDIIFACK